MRILILDACQRAALAATRSLGTRGSEIWTADEVSNTLAGASRFSSQALVYPSPYSEPQQFLEWCKKVLPASELTHVLPMTEVTTDLLARHRDWWPDVTLPLAPIETIDLLSDKVALYQRALELDVPVPLSVVVHDREDVARAVASIGFPAILKPRRSRILTGTQFLSTSVRCARNLAELERLLLLPEFDHLPFLYQQRVEGHGQGIFALYGASRPVAWFAHRRLREKPPDGGVSVLSESCAPDKRLLALAKRLLDDARWHGVAMVEFKVTNDGRPYLMEVNARFWGSLQLAIDAGVDFPALLLEGPSAPGASERPYREHCRLRWFLGDLDRLYMLTARSRGLGWRRILAEWIAFATPHPLSTRHETFRWHDPLPALRELLDYVKPITQRALRILHARQRAA